MYGAKIKELTEGEKYGVIMATEENVKEVSGKIIKFGDSNTKDGEDKNDNTFGDVYSVDNHWGKHQDISHTEMVSKEMVEELYETKEDFDKAIESAEEEEESPGTVDSE